jgi:hypothetical protein
MGLKKWLLSLATCAAVLGTAWPAHAELVFFASGRTLSIKTYRMEGPSLVLVLRGGGEIVCDPSMIVGIGPDEVPYPEPEQPPPAVTAGARPPAAVPSTQSGPQPYAAIIDRVAAQHGVDVKLVHAVIQVESAYHERARSPKGAMGLMQLMPATARQYAVANPFDPVSNIEAGIRHLKSLLQKFPLTLALAAYNAGEATVQRFRGVPPYPETREYVSRVLTLIGR